VSGQLWGPVNGGDRAENEIRLPTEGNLEASPRVVSSLYGTGVAGVAGKGKGRVYLSVHKAPSGNLVKGRREAPEVAPGGQDGVKRRKNALRPKRTL